MSGQFKAVQDDKAPGEMTKWISAGEKSTLSVLVPLASPSLFLCHCVGECRFQHTRYLDDGKGTG